MRDLFITLNILASFPVILMRPYIGITMWCWLSYMNPHRLTWGFAYYLPFALAVALLTMIGTVLSKEPKRLPVNGISVLVVMIAFWVSLTTLFAIMPDYAAEKWDRTIKILAMTFMTMVLVTNRERLQALIWIIVLSLGYYGVKGGIFAIVTAGNYRVWGPQNSFIADNNQLAFSLLVVLPLIRYLQVTTENIWVRRALGCSLLLTGLAVFASYSRGAFLAATVVALMLLLKARRKFLISLGLVVVLAVGASFAPQQWIERMSTIERYDEDGSASGRFDAWKFGYEVAKANPIFGGGFLVQFDHELFMEYVPEAYKPRAFHSIYFEVLGEHGFIGFTLFGMLGLTAAYYCRWIRVRTKYRPELKWAHELSNMMFLSFVAYGVGGAFLNMAFYDLLYHLLTIIMVAKILVQQNLNETLQAKMRPPLTSGAPVPLPAYQTRNDFLVSNR
ncbi:putative O-glycosylation ligase, exosortase A system-associated [Denitrobaculum tricleocarpae]|uniref:Putative O-glycosylation ligase, exosortase A system-associated n=1 Tax=Denitrobaculum tricleocarpae TaxID=2591009 RepID=A0A545TGB9_9PROT|nr:putative O-glycosylation ligase, exosortase A system-associated [Denitrobaculum tricleocarpae]TQV76255.1 putative O-glycosylation ligase, exosortase A system-associated [Denitrobaculum tricleocarpae]